MLDRALASVARQEYPYLEVIVADNANPGSDTKMVVDRYARVIPDLTYLRHPVNVGPIRNFAALLKRARGDYFMWLADDDEITANYVSSLVAQLEADPGAVSAAARWVLMTNERDGHLMPTSSFPDRSAVRRVLRFVWRSDDAFFYALHRTSVLRQAHFPGYWRPIRSVTANWAYVYLLDVVLRGRVVLTPDSTVQFINHDYTEKGDGRQDRAGHALSTRALRRVNVHVLYWRKCRESLSVPAVAAVILTSFAAMGRDAARAGARGVSRRMGTVVHRERDR
jgi:glycosyltransferase involved in cell wall biosynthesis